MGEIRVWRGWCSQAPGSRPCWGLEPHQMVLLHSRHGLVCDTKLGCGRLHGRFWSNQLCGVGPSFPTRFRVSLQATATYTACSFDAVLSGAASPKHMPVVHVSSADPAWMWVQAATLECASCWCTPLHQHLARHASFFQGACYQGVQLTPCTDCCIVHVGAAIDSF